MVHIGANEQCGAAEIWPLAGKDSVAEERFGPACKADPEVHQETSIKVDLPSTI